MALPGRRFARGAAATGLVVSLLGSVLLGSQPTASRVAEAGGLAETPQARLYLRRLPGIAGTVAAIASHAKAEGVKKLVVAFDRSTFAPPRGPSEFSEDHDYAKDLPAWLEALAAWATRDGIELRAGSTGAREWRSPAAGGGWGGLESEIRDARWAQKPIVAFEPAPVWIRRALAAAGILRSAGAGAAGPAAGLLVLVGSERFPERWIDSGSHDEVGSWRRGLLPMGDYFPEERVADVLNQARCPLFVVAPEVRFGDELVLPTLPAFPWASRPIASPTLRLSLGPAVTGEGPDIPRKWPEELLDELRKGRFESVTPLWSPRTLGMYLWDNTDSPAGFGHWPYVRAAAATGGRYAFYPFPPSPWLDTCPSDPALMVDLAPTLEPRARHLAGLSGDPCVAALLEAQKLVFEATGPIWSEAQSFLRRATGWAAVASVRPPVLEERFRLRQMPVDALTEHRFDGLPSLKACEALGRAIETILPSYDRALARVDEAVAGVREGTLRPGTKRAHADLLVGRFWLAMSRFHLHALSIYLQEIRRFLPPGTPPDPEEILIGYTPTIRLSDCLAAYDGRVASPDDEALIGLVRAHAERDEPRGRQENLLPLPKSSPQYRALRSFDAVVKRLDSRLLRDARRMVDTAKDVMGPYGRSPHGWVVYYSEALTFVFAGCKPPKGARTPRHDGDDPSGGKTPPVPGPTTPPGRPGPGGGSGGPTTK